MANTNYFIEKETEFVAHGLTNRPSCQLAEREKEGDSQCQKKQPKGQTQKYRESFGNWKEKYKTVQKE